MFDDLTEVERRLLAAAAAGETYGDASDGPHDSDTVREWGPERTIRASVLRHLLVHDAWPVDPAGVDIEGMRVLGTLDLTDARLRCPLLFYRCVLGRVSLAGASLSRLFMDSCDLTSLHADGMVASSGVRLPRTVTERGMRFLGARITGPLELDDALLGEEDGVSFGADGLVVQGGVSLDRITTAGVVRLVGADITGPLGIHDAHLGRDHDGTSLMADGLVGRGLVGLSGTVADGSVRLPGAAIRGQVSCRRLVLSATDGHSKFVVSSATIDGDLLLDDLFTAHDLVTLIGTRIGGALLVSADLTGARFHASALWVQHDFVWRPVTTGPAAVDLERMHAGRLVDDSVVPNAGWPPAGRLRLVGFTYDDFGCERTVEQRLEWIRRQRPFSPHPYEQLARVYRATGRDADARTVAAAKHHDMRVRGEMTPLRRIGSWLLDVTIRYGYQPGRAVIGLMLLYLAVFGIFWDAQHRPGAIVPARETTTVTTALHCGHGYPCFYPATYALDLSVPVLKVPDSGAWRPESSPFYTTVTLLANLLGWAGTTLAVLGFTGVVRKE